MVDTDTQSCPKCFKKLVPLFRCAEWKIKWANYLLQPVAVLVARVVLAKVFYESGVLKLPSGFLWIGEGEWESTLLLFEYEYSVPILSPDVAAFLGTAVEIGAPILLVLGLGTRIAALALLMMTAVIQFTYVSDYTHAYWASLALFLVAYGGGVLSVDHWLRSASKKCPNYSGMVLNDASSE